jgi:hypothetical protein
VAAVTEALACGPRARSLRDEIRPVAGAAAGADAIERAARG